MCPFREALKIGWKTSSELASAFRWLPFTTPYSRCILVSAFKKANSYNATVTLLPLQQN